jgi:hypothetical protein
MSLISSVRSDRDEQGLGLAYAGLQGLRSWDLLK